MIYFIQDTSSHAIKIGTSKRPLARLSDLQTAHHAPLILIGVMEGSQYEEQALHKKFERLQGEWFEPSRALLAYIRANAVTPQSMGHMPDRAAPEPAVRSSVAIVQRLLLIREVLILIGMWVGFALAVGLFLYSLMRAVNYGTTSWWTVAGFLAQILLFAWVGKMQQKVIVERH